MPAHTVHIAGETLLLHPYRAIYWPAQHTLLVADLHIGKVGHFRKSGIPVPAMASQTNVERLERLIRHFRPKTVLFLGDLFHSDYNREWEVFAFFLARYSKVTFELLLGNHDILPADIYQQSGVAAIEEKIERGPFLFTHEPLEDYQGKLYNLSGHIHPAVRLVGEGRQSMRVPCFYFAQQQGILPAFGSFTGKHTLKPKQGDRIFVPIEDQVMDMSSS